MSEYRVRSSIRPFWYALCLCLTLTACVQYSGVPHSELQPPPPGLSHLNDGTWIFRHRVRFDMPDKKLDLNADGMMRLDTTDQSIHLAGLGGLGLRLFELRITPGSAADIYLHPSLNNIPDAAERIAWSVRRIWFDCLTVLPPDTQSTARIRETRHGLTLEHVFEHARLVSTRTIGQTTGGTEDWLLRASEYTDTDPWPRLMLFENKREHYTLTIRLLQAQHSNRQ